MKTERKITYSIQDAFKSLAMLEDEEVLIDVDDASASEIVTEQFEKDDTVVDDLDMGDIDRQIETLTEHLYKLKEAYDKNPKSLTKEELKELYDANLIEERQTTDLKDKDEVEQAFDALSQEDAADNIEVVVDVNAESEDELKDNYIGNFIIQCNICKTLIYKEPEEVIYSDDEDDDSVNYDEECPHCKSTDGFVIIGKVAPIEEIEEEEETPEEEVAPKEDESKEPDEDKEPASEETSEEDIEEEDKKEVKKIKTEESVRQSLQLQVDEIDDELVNKLITKYLHEIYENVDTFKTTSGKIDEDLNRLTLTGDISFKSGKKLTTVFIFEAFEATKKGKIRFIGKNEGLSAAKKPFTLVTSVTDKKLIVESFTYNYSVKVDEELKRIYGRVM